MKPEHEYKVMGLARIGIVREPDFFRKINVVKGTKYLIKPARDLYFHPKVSKDRFDGIAWGLQAHLERFLPWWVDNCIKHFNLRDDLPVLSKCQGL